MIFTKFYEADGVQTGGTQTTTQSNESTLKTGEAQQATEAQSPVNADEFLKVDKNKDPEKIKVTEEVEKLRKINATIQSNFDKERLEKQKFEDELKKEREKTLTSKQLEELKEQEMKQQVESQKRELETEKLKFNKSKLLFEKEWDIDFLDIVAGDSIESFTDNCQKLQSKLDKFIEKKINARLSQGNPTLKTGSGTTEDVFTEEEINTLPKKNGTEWTMKNLDKINRSMTYWNK